MKNFAALKESVAVLPVAVQNEVIERMAMAMLSIVLILSMLIIGMDHVYIVPAVGLLLFLLLRAGIPVKQMFSGAYLVLDGQCLMLEYTGLKRYVKSMILQVGDDKVKVFLRGKTVKNLMESEYVRLYISEKTPVYEEDGCKIINSYIAISRKEKT